MLVSRTSTLTGIRHTMDIPVTSAQLDAWRNGTLIQNAMPNLTPDQREFLMTGITPTEWNMFFAEEN